MVTLKSAKRIALTFFIIGSMLFGIQMLLPNKLTLAFLGILFLFVAALVNGIAFLLAFIRLIKKDCLESFFVMCILLINLPIAWLYSYIILNSI